MQQHSYGRDTDTLRPVAGEALLTPYPARQADGSSRGVWLTMLVSALIVVLVGGGALVKLRPRLVAGLATGSSPPAAMNVPTATSPATPSAGASAPTVLPVPAALPAPAATMDGTATSRRNLRKGKLRRADVAQVTDMNGLPPKPAKPPATPSAAESEERAKAEKLLLDALAEKQL